MLAFKLNGRDMIDDVLVCLGVLQDGHEFQDGEVDVAKSTHELVFDVEVLDYLG